MIDRFPRWFTFVRRDENPIELGTPLRNYCSLCCLGVNAEDGNVDGADGSSRHAPQEYSILFGVPASTHAHEVDALVGDVGGNLSRRIPASELDGSLDTAFGNSFGDSLRG